MRGRGARPRVPLAAQFVRDACEMRSPPMPITNSAMVDSISGAPTIAPSPTAVCAAAESRPVSSATAGMKVSGSAVPTAASRLPTAASAICSRCPAHSTPLVKSSEPDKNYREAERQDYCVDCQNSARSLSERIESLDRDFQSEAFFAAQKIRSAMQPNRQTMRIITVDGSCGAPDSPNDRCFDDDS